MNTTNEKGTWTEQKERLKKRFKVLTDKDLSFETGRKDLMLGKLAEKLGKTKEELNLILERV